MSRLALLKNRHSGQRCVVVANGPSLNQMDLGFLRNETVIGLNKIYLGFRKFRFYPRYYVAVNRKVIHQAAPEIKAMNCVKFIGDAGADGQIKEDALTYLVNTCMPGQRFCRDIALEGMHEGWTVTYAALQVAYFLGFSQVVLIGLDHRYEYAGQPNEARRMDGPDPNHFSPGYFGHGQDWDNPDLARSEESYRIARQVFEDSGRSIVDATLGGACEIFDKVDYLQISRVLV
ncbi:6-hydroxymethylpterin diphosphokinase MptE-like protein [Lacisediminimonas profundi]|uniref:6-hydroxymethylpterin diphosphokinase MptE-like protein n=1 Tax=Lacisediminimonas profundi TaxID=2603856 RepID=UPI00124B8EB0|nr:6-hydroxymethylpterin diphosphokinase MptE-like protein [Lacisediminimonas profundi]